MSARVPKIEKTIDFRLSLADLGNAQRLVYHFGADLRYVGPQKLWYYFDGTRWVADETGEVMRCGKATALAIRHEQDLFDDPAKVLKWARTSKSGGKLETMVRLAETEPEIAIIPEDLDADPWLLNVENGTIDLQTGELRTHDARDLLTKMCGASYDADARSDRWEQFLQTATGGNTALQRYIQRAVGCSLSGAGNEKALFVLLGGGDTGKSTLLRILLEVLGDYAIQAERNLLLQQSHESHPTGLADLFGRRMAVCTEVNREQRFDAALVKQLTGGDRVKARRMRQDFFEFNPTHTIWLACNDIPGFDPTDEALWNRLRILPFTHRIPRNEQDPYLVEGLLEDRAAILTWAVQGCLDWQREDLDEPAELRAAKEEQRKLVDPVLRFVSDGCEREDGVMVEATLLYGVFKTFAQIHGLGNLTQKAFGSRLTALGLEKGRGGNGRTTYLGIRPLNDLNLLPLSTQETENIGGITENPSEGSEEDQEVAHAPR